ncbi:MAG: alpha-L-fucosidase [Phocaeicola sp.]|uniref:alpha-L-fucosidase n=1 Tax=Phocaeicola sp. TaxID=2773926 RepID=UPI003FA0F115
MITLKKHLLAAALLMISGAGFAQSYTTKYEPTKENLEARKEFQDEKFGIFLHWGIYSMTAQGEWYMNEGKIDRNEYAKLASGFYPSKFNAAEWVSAIKASGAKYITITSRHHDGFSMFGTKQSDYNIVDATPFHRDVLKELAEECKKQGIKLHFYYSHLDWRRDDYPEGRTGHFSGRPAGHGDYNSYFNFMNNQLTELLTNYGPIGAIWFDGLWDHDQDSNFNWRLDEQYALIHKLQPSCLVGNNHHRNPYSGEDFQMFERDLPGQNVTGYSKGTDVSQLPLETCETMNGMWGYKIQDQNYKTTEQLIRYLVKAAGMNANLLMNIGPQPNGELPAVAVQRMKEVGQWMNSYGETIYGTRGGDVAPHDWGVSTRKGDKLYIHIIHLKDKALYIPLEAKIKSATRFIDKKTISFKAQDGGYLLQLPEVPADVDYVVELTLK